MSAVMSIETLSLVQITYMKYVLMPQAPKTAEGVIDIEVFQQIRDMDEDEDEGSGDEEPNSFSKGIVWGFFDQAEQTFKDIEQAL